MRFFKKFGAFRNLIEYVKLCDDEDYEDFDEEFEACERQRKEKESYERQEAEFKRRVQYKMPDKTPYKNQRRKPQKRTEGAHVYDFSGCKVIPYFRIDQMLEKKDKKFSETLLYFIDRSGKSDVDVYKNAGIDRKHFSKIRKNPDYMPKKSTVFAFAIALELSVMETEQLLQSAGYALSNSYETDIIIKFFLQRKIYNQFIINETLQEYQLESI